MSLFPAYAPDGDGKSKTEKSSVRHGPCNITIFRTAGAAASTECQPATAREGTLPARAAEAGAAASTECQPATAREGTLPARAAEAGAAASTECQPATAREGTLPARAAEAGAAASTECQPATAREGTLPARTAEAGAAAISECRLAGETAAHTDFYFDRKPDTVNLEVSTLHIPGRPIYKRISGKLLGGVGGGRKRGRAARPRRYYSVPAPPAPPLRELGAREAAERARHTRRMLRDNPGDEELWLRYIDFQEEWGDGEAWRAACEAACGAARDRGADGGRARHALHRARRATLPPADLLRAAAEDAAAEKEDGLRLEGWLRLAWALADGAEGASGVERVAPAALAALPRCARAYPLLLFVYGAALRGAGLWEQLVLLVELVCAVNFPPSAAFPPAPAPAPAAAEAEQRLQRAEDAVIDSGLPLSTVWVRVERLRSAAHWQPAGAGEGEGAGEGDPQRAPAAAEVQALVQCARPGARLLLCVSLLRLAQVPLLPGSAAAVRAGAAGAHDAAEPAAVALCVLHRAARRLPAARRPAAAALRAALPALLDPPHYFSDEAGYLAWVSALWEACCTWAAGARARAALACWWLRWLHVLARAAPAGEARRLRGAARRVLRTHARASPAAVALFARVDAEADADGGQGARRAALQAVRGGGAGVEALFAARVVRELGAGGAGGAALWALCCAATGRALPADDSLDEPPPLQLQEEALQQCSKQCAELEHRFQMEAAAGGEAEGEGAEEEALLQALSCGAGEWGAARVLLLPAPARAALLHRLLHTPHAHIHHSGASLQYYESCAAALAQAEGWGRGWGGGGAGRGRGHVARQLLPLFPHNALLALESSADGLWSRAGGCGGGGGGVPRSLAGALASVLPALCAAAQHDAEPAGTGAAAAAAAWWRRAAGACARAMGAGARHGAGAGAGAGGAALWAVRLQAEARGAAPARLHRLLLAALHDHPNDKWLYVRGAACVAREAEALCDAAVERALRVHAHTHELRL